MFSRLPFLHAQVIHILGTFVVSRLGVLTEVLERTVDLRHVTCVVGSIVPVILKASHLF